MQKFKDARDWFFQKLFGLFIHWGIYAVGGVQEQELQRFHVPWERYLEYQKQFTAKEFHPSEWLDLAEKNGMQYLVFTTKHHDGFCMWDTRETDFNVMHTPCGRDLLRELADECHKRNFPLVLYYSVVDWHHPNYPNLGRHHEIQTDPANHDIGRYMQFLKNQIRELCTNYGKIDGIWWDMNVPKIQDPSINAMIRSLQPSAVINNRGMDTGDFTTPERSFQADPTLPFANPTEACNSVGSNSWGYRAQEDYFSIYHLERQMASNLALGGNYLLNAGPRADGRFPPESVKLLNTLGDWFRKTASAVTAPPCYGVLDDKTILCTGGGRELNLVLLNPPACSALELAPLNVLPEKAVLLNTGTELEATMEPNVYRLQEPRSLRLRGIPVDQLAGQVPVVRLTFAEPVIQGKAVVAQENHAGINEKE